MLDFFLRSREAQRDLEQARQRLYRVAYAWCHNPALADDLVQETLTKALQKSAQLRDPKARDAWLFTIMANCFRDHFRRQRDMDDVDDMDIPHDDTPELESSRTQIIGLVRRAIERLPEGQRQVVTLIDLEGFSYLEVAQILDIPIGTVMSRLCRARGVMKAMLLPELQQQAGSRIPELRRVK